MPKLKKTYHFKEWPLFLSRVSQSIISWYSGYVSWGEHPNKFTPQILPRPTPRPARDPPFQQRQFAWVPIQAPPRKKNTTFVLEEGKGNFKTWSNKKTWEEAILRVVGFDIMLNLNSFIDFFERYMYLIIYRWWGFNMNTETPTFIEASSKCNQMNDTGYMYHPLGFNQSVSGK